MSEENLNEQKCLFCGKTKSQVQQMFTKQDGVICNECVLEFVKSFTSENAQRAKQYATKKLGNILDRVINRLIYKI